MSSNFSLPVLLSSAHSFEDESNEYSGSNEAAVPQNYSLPIPDIPFRRKLIREELKKFTDTISNQKIEINNQLLVLEEAQNQVLSIISDKAKLYFDIIQLNKSIKKAKQSISPELKQKFREKSDQLNHNIKATDEENSKIQQMIKENQKLNQQLQNKTQNLINERNTLMNQFINSVSYETKRQIRSLNDKIDVQERRLHGVSAQYEDRIKEKDEIISNLRTQLFEAQKKTSNYVVTKRERLKRPSMVIRDTTSILQAQEKQTEQNEITKQSCHEDTNDSSDKQKKHHDDDTDDDSSYPEKDDHDSEKDDGNDKSEDYSSSTEKYPYNPKRGKKSKKYINEYSESNHSSKAKDEKPVRRKKRKGDDDDDFDY